MAFEIEKDEWFGEVYLEKYIPEEGETTVIIPDGVTYIGSYVFENCENIQEVRLPESINNIERCAFEGCKKLTTINFPEGLKYIDDRAFWGCEKLRDLHFPDSLETISSSAFSGCYGLVDTNGFIRTRDRLVLCYSDDKEIAIPDDIAVIGENSFWKCKNLESVVIPKSVKKIEQTAFYHCENLKTVSFDMNFPEIVEHYDQSSFPFRVEYRFPPHAIQKLKLPSNIFKAMNKDNFDSDDFAYILANMSTKPYLDFIYTANINASEVLGKTCLLLEKGKIKDTRAKFLTEFAVKNLDRLEAQDITGLVDFLKKANPASAARMEVLPEIKEKLSGAPTHPIEQYVKDAIAVSPLHEKIASQIKSGLPYADGSGISSVNAVAFVLSEYAKMYEQMASFERGNMANIAVLENGYLLTPSETADHVAEALDQEALVQLLRDKLYLPQYRLYVLAFARYAGEESIQLIVRDIKFNRKGNVKARYKARNFEEALYLSDTRAAVEYFEANKKLHLYARSHGMAPEDLQLQKMLPTFGMDESGTLCYDVGGDTVKATLTSDLTFEFLDTNTGNVTKSFPKKSGIPEKNACCATEFSKTKKEINDIIRKHIDTLKKMHMSGTTLSVATWKNTYLNHPVIKKLAGLLVWQDEKQHYFAVDDNGNIFDVLETSYIPDGKIGVAHVLDMPKEEVAAWQKLLTCKKKKQLFTQMWEPIVINDAIITSLTTRYEGAILTNAERTAFRAKMKAKGIDVHAKEMLGEFQPKLGSYAYDTENDMYLGNDLSLHYTIDVEKKEITLGKMSVSYSPNTKELNALIAELDILTLRHQVQADRYELLTDDTLESFTLLQIDDLLNVSVKSNAVKCSAVLLNYKNKHFADFDPMEEFTLE